MGQFDKDILQGGAVFQKQFISQLADAGFDRTEAHAVLAEAYNMDTTPEDAERFQNHFKDEKGEVNVEKVAAFSNIWATRMTVDSYLPVLEERADNTDNETNLNDLENVVELFHASGYSAEEIKQTIEKYIKISKSATPHPTEHLSPNGIGLARELVNSVEVSQSNREKSVYEAIKNIAESDDFSASQKANIVDEADNSNIVARIHNQGANELDRQLEEMIFNVTGERVDINTNTGQKSWDYDADGKPNADGFAMMMKLTTTSSAAMADVFSALENALNTDISLTQRKAFQNMKGKIGTVRDEMQHVYDRSRQITRELAEQGNPDKRQALYEQYYTEEYESLFDQLAGVYDKVDSKARGLNFFNDALKVLDSGRKNLETIDEDAAFKLDDVYRTLKRNGLALEKGQTRHNDLVYTDMLDNMFSSKPFSDLKILNNSDLNMIRQADEGKFSNLHQDDQYRIMQQVLDHAKINGNREKVTNILEAANPLKFGGNGYPDQNASYSDRMKLRALFPYKFEEGVISDAGAFGSPRQKFIADLYGIENMKHMSLNEDRQNLARQGQLPRVFNEHGGAENREYRKEKGIIPNRKEVEKRMVKALHLMRPASDAERAGGSFTRLQAMDQYRKTVREAYDMQIPIEVMIGGGQSLNRFGGDVDMVRRILAQELKDIFQEKQENGEQSSDYDHNMMIMATSILYTEQGRTKRILSATSDQVRDNLAGKVSNVLKDLLDLKGDVVDNTFIDKRARFSEKMDKLQRRVADQAINDFVALNQSHVAVKGKLTDELLLDTYTEEGGIPHLVPKQNNGARPAAGKASSAKKSKTSGFRAIGKDQTLFSMQSYHAGFYSTGAALQRIHEALHTSSDKNRITLDDIDDLMNNDDWNEAIFSRNLIDASRFNEDHLFNKIFGAHQKQDWDYKRMMDLGNEIVMMNAGNDEKGNGRYTMRYEGAEDVTQEQLYYAKIYHDRAKFLAMTEAALTPKGQGVTIENTEQEILASFAPSEGLSLEPGAHTQEKWPTVIDQTIVDHKKNAPMFALNNMVNEDIEARLNAKQSREHINMHYGQGDPKQADAFERLLGSALRAGSLPHKDKWNGIDTHGIENRYNVDMKQLIANANDANPDLGHHLDNS